MPKPLLMASGSMHNADMYYATHFLAVDPFIYLRVSHEGKDILVVSQIEYERAIKESMVKQIRSTHDYGYDIKTEELITKVLQEESINAIEVPRYFPKVDHDFIIFNSCENENSENFLYCYV